MAAALRRERLVLVGGIAVMVMLAWVYLIDRALDMAAMPMDGNMPMPMTWSTFELALLFLMWAVMMVAMMLPSALPMILTFAGLNQRRRGGAVLAYLFVAGYIAAWTLYAAGATLLQWFLHERALISPAMASHVSSLSGGILIAAGIFQWTPLKQTCLQHCRSPLSLLLQQWREGYRGAFGMGLRQGGYCVGCCWLLMLILFVTGVMNLLAVALISVFVLTEKLAPRGRVLGQLSGLLLVAIGVGLIVVNA